MSSAVSPSPLNERAVRHPSYYIPGGDVVFRVENTLFRVHRYFFTRDSSVFLDKLPHPPPPGEFSKGSSDNNPLFLEDTLKVDFENLLWVFYNEKYNIYEADVEVWSSILKLAHKWKFVEVKAFALRELEQLDMPALDKIILYHTHEINRNLLQAAYTALTIRDEPITIDEGYQLGLETALRLAHAREIARAPSGRRAGAARSTVITGPELDMLINQLFNLSLPDASNASTERPATPQTPTVPGRGTPTGGRSTPQLAVQTNGSGSPAPNPARGNANGINGHGHANGINGRPGRK